MMMLVSYDVAKDEKGEKRLRQKMKKEKKDSAVLQKS